MPLGIRTSFPGRFAFQLLCKPRVVSSPLCFFNSLSVCPTRGAELPSQLWGQLLIPTTALWGQLSLVRLWFWLTAGGRWPGVRTLSLPGACFCPGHAGSGRLESQLPLRP